MAMFTSTTELQLEQIHTVVENTPNYWCLDLSMVDDQAFQQVSEAVEHGDPVSFFVNNSHYNNGQLKTVQDYIEHEKLAAAMRSNGSNPDAALPPSAWLLRHRSKKNSSKTKYFLVIGDGNHRLAIALLQYQPIEIHIKTVWDEETQGPFTYEDIFGNQCQKYYGFNKVLTPIRQYAGKYESH